MHAATHVDRLTRERETKNMDRTEQRELLALWLLANEGVADEAQLRQLNERLESDAEARAYLLDVARQQGLLAWYSASQPAPAAAPFPMAALAADAGEARDESCAACELPPRAAPLSPRRSAGWAVLAASVVGFAAGAWVMAQRDDRADVVSAGAPIQARMVSATGCVWAPGSTSRSLSRGQLVGGDSLQLLEGIAEFTIGAGDANVDVQMEGPASIQFAGPHAASVNYGKVILRSGMPLERAFPIETAFGRVLLEADAEVGILSFGSTSEIHCFRGGMTIESPWMPASETGAAHHRLGAGEGLKFTEAGGVPQAQRVAASELQFTPQTSMSTDYLAVSADYVREILAAAPVAYWRFEESQDGVVKNEMGPLHPCRVKGEVGFAGPAGNRAVELGLGPQHGSVVADDSWDDVLGGDFTIELWMKPSHYHTGSMVGFVAEFDAAKRRNKHGILLEVCGPTAPSWLKPNQLRFLHRSERSAEAVHGVSCYSGVTYDVRQWQHLVAVRKGSEMRLYLDGKLLATAEESAPTPRGLQLVLGQLYTETVERFFIGHMDEAAIYNRALTEDEVRKHHELLRPEAAARSSHLPETAAGQNVATIEAGGLG
jgi:hypothetical protein